MRVYAGRPQAFSAGWDTLCRDARGFILSKLSLADLARAAPTCREFKKACLRKVADERANLLCAAEKCWGMDSFRTLVVALQRPLCGCLPSPSLLADCDQSSVSRHVDHSRRSTLVYLAEPFNPDAMDHKLRVVKTLIVRGSAIAIGRTTFADHLFSAQLFQGFGGAVPCTSPWDVFRFGRDNVHLQLLMHKEAAASAMGLLLALSTEISEALPASCRSPLTVNLFIWGFPDGADGASVVREAQELVAPLRSLAECITIYPQIDLSACTLHLVRRKRQARPLGIVNVRPVTNKCT